MLDAGAATGKLERRAAALSVMAATTTAAAASPIQTSMRSLSSTASIGVLTLLASFLAVIAKADLRLFQLAHTAIAQLNAHCSTSKGQTDAREGLDDFHG